jgi:hypothetical protein
MYRLIGVDQNEYGPVAADQVRKWLLEGRVNAQTRIKGDTDADWKLLGDCPELIPASQPRARWVCPRCGEHLETQFDSCWRCSTQRPSPQAATAEPQPQAPPASPKLKWVVEYQIFRATFETWDELFSKAADFATEIGRDRLIGFSHSEDKSDGVVTVWFWSQEEEVDAKDQDANAPAP